MNKLKFKKNLHKNSRVVALELIAEVLNKQKNLNTVLPAYKSHLEKSQDAALLQNLVFGVLRWFPMLQHICHACLEKPLKAKDNLVLYIICLGLYQLIYTRIPAYAVISETVETARSLNLDWSTKLINAVLRRFQRERSELLLSVETHLEAKFAHPAWWIELLQETWPQDWEAILTENNREPPMILRVNQQKCSRSQYLELLKQSNFEADPLPHHPEGIWLKNAVPVFELPHFEQGFCSVQDAAPQWVASLMALQPGLRVLDACAAPGGKTAHMLELEPKLQELIALDISDSRQQMIQENLLRLGLHAKLITADALQPEVWFNGRKFDRILLDAPCTASGVIRRHPDIKYLRKKTDIKKMAELQFALLTALFSLLAPQGILVYTTCSVFPEENENVIQKFINYQKEASVLPVSFPIGLAQKLGHQILPGQGQMDGFYYARIGKC